MGRNRTWERKRNRITRAELEASGRPLYPSWQVKPLEEREWKIYRTCDPVTGETRYIGQTGQSLTKRLSEHMTSCRRNDKRSCGNLLKGWLRQFDGYETTWPTIEPLQSVDYKEKDVAEALWIAHFTESGARLLNKCYCFLNTAPVRVRRKYKKRLITS